MKTDGLDYTFIQDYGEFHVCTPDSSGAVIGSGKTRKEAMQSAIDNLTNLSAQILNEKNPESHDE